MTTADAGWLGFMVTEATRPFWNASHEDRLVLPYCEACARAHWYPRHTCPYCASREIVWRDATGQGEVLTFTIARQNFGTAGVRREPPYIVALVTLAEGPTMTTVLGDCRPDQAGVGLRVKVQFEEVAPDRRVPVFVPIT